MMCALATGEDATTLAEPEPDSAEAGWHPGLATAPAPLRGLASFFKSEPGATLDQTLGDENARLVGVVDVSRHEFDLPTHSVAPDFGLYLTALAVD